MGELANDTAEPFGIGAETWPGLAKLGEEAGEVVQVVLKLVATGGVTEHWSGETLRERLVEEMGDLTAALEYVKLHNGLTGVNTRATAKTALFEQWHRKPAPPSTQGAEDG